jgi:hypothetical protein
MSIAKPAQFVGAVLQRVEIAAYGPAARELALLVAGAGQPCANAVMPFLGTQVGRQLPRCLQCAHRFGDLQPVATRPHWSPNRQGLREGNALEQRQWSERVLPHG